VGAHELDLGAAPGARRRAPVGLARGQRVGEHPLPEGRREAEVDEAGTRDLGRPLEPAGGRRGLEAADQQAGDGMRRAALGARQDERGVGREVSEAGIARYLDGEGRRLRYTQLAGFDGSAQRLADEPLNVALHPRPRDAKDSRRDAGPGRGERAWRSLYAPLPGARAAPGPAPRPAAARRRRGSAGCFPLAGARRRGGFFGAAFSVVAPARSTSSTTESAAASPWRAPSLTTRVQPPARSAKRG